MDEAIDCGILIPNTKLISSQLEIAALRDFGKKVFKPVFSRFASHTLISPKKEWNGEEI